MAKKFQYLVYIGRFQPFHIGHYSVCEHALEISENLIIVIGSHRKAPDIRNPLSSSVRRGIIGSVLNESSPDQNPRIHFVYQEDHLYNEERWIAGIQTAVNSIAMRSGWSDKNPDIGIIGYNKDHTSYYMKKFPLWEIVEFAPKYDVNATDVREYFYSEASVPRWWVNDDHARSVRNSMAVAIRNENLKLEHLIVQNYRKSWENVPYPVTFQTVDALVTQSGHILLVERKAYPGKGQWALPGGFVNQTETLEEACFRELREETKLAVPTPVLKGSVVKVNTYDAPNRSTRGRTITQCFQIRLVDQENLPRVKGSDDARKAFWIPLSEFVKNRNKIFEDHFSIVENMLGI